MSSRVTALPPEKSRRPGRAWATGAVLGLLFGLGLTTPAPASTHQGSDVHAVAAPAPSRERARMNRRVFDQVWNEVRRDYYDPRLNGVDWNAARAVHRPRALAAPDDLALYRILGEMLAPLEDRHAAAIPPAVVRNQSAPRVARPVLGVSLTLEPGGEWRIEQVRPGSAAEASGLEPGWTLERMDGRPWSPDLVLAEGNAVLLDLRDGQGAPRRVALLPRTMAPVPPFVADRSREGVLVLRIEAFEAGLGDWLGRELSGVTANAGVVLDLRGNPGGRLHEADALLSCFLPDGLAWGVRTTRDSRPAAFSTYAGCGGLDGPVPARVAVLVDGDSRSAAELTPAVLQEFGRAVVVGRTTAGSVLIARDSPLPDGGRLTLSRADFTTLSGVRLERRGVRPDIVAETTFEDARAGRDPALDAAVAAVARLPSPSHP